MESHTHLHWPAQLRLLLWKNWLCYRSRPWQLVISLVVPMAFFVVLVFMRIRQSPFIVQAQHFQPIDIQPSILPILERIKNRRKIFQAYQSDFTYSHYAPRPVIAYSPDHLEGVTQIMEEARADLYGIELIALDSCADVHRRMKSEYFFAGVCFSVEHFTRHPTESMYFIDLYPNNIRFVLVFPSEIRIYDDIFAGAFWNTEVQFDRIQMHWDRLHKDNDGGYMGYIREGFIALQHAVTMAYIRLITKKETLPTIKIQQYPTHRYERDMLQDNMAISLSMTIVLGFIYPLARIQQKIVAEKKSSVMRVMERASLKPWIHQVAWLITGFAIMSVVSLGVVAVLKITWSSGHSLLFRSSWSVLLLFLVSYSLSAVSFWVMMSAFVSSLTGCALTLILWFIVYVPYPWGLLLLEEQEFTHKAFLFPLVNSAFGFALNQIIKLEQLEVGFQWEHLVNEEMYHQDMTMGLYILVFYAQSLVYMIVGVYAGCLSKFHIPCPAALKRYFLRRRIKRFENRASRSVPNARVTRIWAIAKMGITKVYEVDPLSTEPVIEIDGVSKDYDGELVVNDVSLSLYANEIIALMGHSSSGKSVLLSLLVGNIKPDEGRILIHGAELTASVRRGIGSCLNNTEFLPDLTVKEQLGFFMRMRGVTDSKRIRNDINTCLSIMKLESHRDTLARDLNVVAQKALAVCCALCGDPKVVVLDYPSESMDGPMRTCLWDLLQYKRTGRTIVMTCTTTEEAEFVADRIAVMSSGELKCYGSSFFLKSVYGYGFTLTIFKGPRCDVDEVTKLLKRHIPKIEPDCDLGSMMSFTIRDNHTNNLVKILTDIEVNGPELDINHCEIRQSPMEDVYLKMGSEDPSDGDRYRHSQILNGITAFVWENEMFTSIDAKELNRGSKLAFQRWAAIFRKRFLHDIRSTKAHYFSLYLVMLLTSMTVHRGKTPDRMPTLFYDLSRFAETISVVEIEPDTSGELWQISEMYTRRIFWLSQKHKYEVLHNESLEYYITKKKRHNVFLTNKLYQVAMTLKSTDEEIIAWFNNFALHTAPISLNVVHNSLLWSLLDTNSRIEVGFEPLHLQNPVKPAFDRALMDTATAISVVNCVSFLVSFWNIFLIREKSLQFKFHQRLAGVGYLQYWAASFSFDIVRHIIIATVLELTICILLEDTTISFLYWFVMILGNLAISSSNYVLLRCFKDPATGYVSIALFNLFGMLCFCTISEFSNRGFTRPVRFPLVVEYPFYIFPQFIFIQALCKLVNIDELRALCEDNEIHMLTVVLEECKIYPKCCYPMYLWKSATGIHKEVVTFVVIIVVSWIIVGLCEYRSIKNYLNVPDEYDDGEYNEDVANTGILLNESVAPEVYEEIDRVHRIFSSGEDRTQYPILCAEVGLLKPGHIALHQVFLHVERGECFSVLGSNRSGKSTLLKILCAETQMTYGCAEIFGVSVKRHADKISQLLSYCPEYQPYMPCYTGLEILELFADLYGIPRSTRQHYIQTLVKFTGMARHVHKYVAHLSAGMKSRLKLIVAMMSSAPLLLLDEPTLNIDSSGKRIIWNVILQQHIYGKTILVASTFARESQVLCDRMVIMSSAKFWCIGATRFLVDKYSNSYVLRLKIQQQSAKLHANTRSKIEDFMNDYYPQARLQYTGLQTMVYTMPMTGDSMSSILNTMHENSFLLSIETIDITRDTLDYIFHDITATRSRLSVF